MAAIEMKRVSKSFVLKRKQRGGLTLRDAAVERLRELFTLSKKHKDEEFWALRSIDLTIKQGECVALIGTNGSGKSTLLKILARVNWPTEGEIMMRGRIAALLDIGAGFHPDLTGRENIFLRGALLGMRPQETRMRFDEIVSFAEIDTFIDLPIKKYSNGMFLRLAFSIAAFLDCDILLIDEVLAVGDAAFQSKCVSKMRALVESGKTVIFVTHQLKVAKNFCKRAIWLAQGKIQDDGNAKEVIAAYLQT